MSERELNRIEVLSRVDDGTLTATRAADLLNLSRRQVQRLFKRFRSEGVGGIRHRARGCVSNHRIDPDRRKYALELIRDNYADFGELIQIDSSEHH